VFNRANRYGILACFERKMIEGYKIVTIKLGSPTVSEFIVRYTFLLCFCILYLWKIHRGKQTYLKFGKLRKKKGIR
jgi:hypothetical protein